MKSGFIFAQASALICALGYSGIASADVIFIGGFEPGFQIELPEMTVASGEATTFCYFTRIPNANPSAIRRWSSTMQSGLHHLVVYTTYDSAWQPIELQPEGTLSNSGCNQDITDSTGWLYSAHDPVNMLALPTDDGAGLPLAFELQSNQPIAIEMYVVNTTGGSVTTSAVLRADLLPDGTQFSPTASYTTSNLNLSLPPMSTSTFTYTCPVPAGVRFWWLSTRTHRFATSASISDNTTQLVQSTDWEHPQILEPAQPGYQFSGSGLTYSCAYLNPTGQTIHTGLSESSDEVCIAIGFFYPATRPSICLNNVGPL